MNRAIIYVHGKGGTAAETEHYKKFFPTHDKTASIGSTPLSSLPFLINGWSMKKYEQKN